MGNETLAALVLRGFAELKGKQEEPGFKRSSAALAIYRDPQVRGEVLVRAYYIRDSHGPGGHRLDHKGEKEVLHYDITSDGVSRALSPGGDILKAAEELWSRYQAQEGVVLEIDFLVGANLIQVGVRRNQPGAMNTSMPGGMAFDPHRGGLRTPYRPQVYDPHRDAMRPSDGRGEEQYEAKVLFWFDVNTNRFEKTVNPPTKG